jgi:hypothetical protein
MLHELHLQNRTYGKVVAANVLLRPSGAELAPARGYWAQGGPEGDVKSFGALLYQLVTGMKLPADASAALFRPTAPPSGPAGIRAAALRLAGKCTGHLSVTLTMQQASTEVRLLWVVARQLETAGVSESAATYPFLAMPEAPPPQEIPQVVPPPPKPSPRMLPQVPPPLPFTQQVEPPVRDQPPAPAGAGASGAPPLVPPEAADFSKTPAKTVPLEPAGGNCPKCDSTVVYRSRARSKFERLLERWKIPICRCHRCYHRYVIFARLRIGKEMPVGTGRRFKPRRRN